MKKIANALLALILPMFSLSAAGSNPSRGGAGGGD